MRIIFERKFLSYERSQARGIVSSSLSPMRHGISFRRFYALMRRIQSDNSCTPFKRSRLYRPLSLLLIFFFIPCSCVCVCVCERKVIHYLYPFVSISGLRQTIPCEKGENLC